MTTTTTAHHPAAAAAPSFPRVAYLSADPGVPVFGSKGASVHVQEIVRSLRTRGSAVGLYATRTGDLLPPDLADVTVRHIPVDGGGRDQAPAARTALRERNQAAAASRLAGHVMADGADLVYERYSLFSTALAQVCSTLRIPGVLEVNAPLIEEQATHRHLVDEAGARHTLRTQVAAAAVVACVSQPVADWVLGHCPGAADKVLVTPNGVNTARIAPDTGVPAGDELPTVLFVGTLKPWHGTDVLLDAAARADRAWRVRIVGDGPEGPALAGQAQRLGLDVDFRGAVAPHEVPAALRGAAVAVAPYPADVGATGQYFSPLKVYEYAAAGLPVVASRVGQVPVAVRHGHTGLLVPPSDPTSLARAIDTLVADPAGARAMGLAGRELMVREHSWDAVLGRILAPLQAVPSGQAVPA